MIITIGSKVKDGEGNTYTLTEELGHGGFGCVYKAECEADKSVYAVKTLLYSFGDEATAASFKNEVRISSEVSGEHVIRYIYAHDGDEYPELPPYIIMEYAEGGTLEDQIEERKKTNSPYSKEELRNLFLQLVAGMKSINKKLVHRDIKPENILICDGICKITDFGLAKVASESTRTMSFKGYGTLQYIAPEAWKSEKNTIQMDIYSMGIVFYELALLNNLLRENQQYDTELKNFLDYLKQRDLLNKCFDLSLYDIDQFFDSLVGIKMGVSSTLNAYIAALSCLFEYLMREKYNFRDLLGYIGSAEFRKKYLDKLENGSQKKIIPMDILQKLLYKMDYYFSKDHGKSQDKIYHLLIARVYIELSLIIPLKPSDLLEIKVGELRNETVRTIVHNSISIQLPKSVRTHIIESIDFAEKQYDAKYSEKDSLFIFLYNAIGKKVNPSTITAELQKLYKELKMDELLETYKSGTKNVSLYPLESYKKTAIYEMLNNGINIVYLKQLTGLEISTLLADYDLEMIKSDIDVKSYNINSCIVNSSYFTYL